MSIKGFKPTGYGTKSGFNFSSAQGFTGSTGSVTSVTAYTRRKGYASGGFVKEGYQPKVEKIGDSGHATTLRNRPSTNLDQESGGKTPLRPGFKKGGKAKMFGGGALANAMSTAIGRGQSARVGRSAPAVVERTSTPMVAKKKPPMNRRSDGGPIGNATSLIRHTSDKLSQREKESKRDDDMATARIDRRAVEHNLAEYKRAKDPGMRTLIQKANDMTFGVPNHTPNFNTTRDFKPKLRKFGDGGKAAMAKGASEKLFRIYSRTGDKLVGTAKSRRGASKVLDRRDTEYGATNHYIIHPDGMKSTYDDGGRVGMISNLVKRVMRKAPAAVPAPVAEKAATRAPATMKPRADYTDHGYLDRRSGERKYFVTAEYRDEAMKRRKKLEGEAGFDPIDSGTIRQKRRGGAVKMTRC
jgi:hypothetical protein